MSESMTTKVVSANGKMSVDTLVSSKNAKGTYSASKNIFIRSAKEFYCLRSLVTAALLIALHTVLSCFVSVQVTPALRISISFLTNVITGYLFGPVMGLTCAGLGDIIGWFVKPTGPYFYGWTMSACLAGLIYGLFFYSKSPRNKVFDIWFFIRCTIALTLDTVLVNILLGTYWVNVMYGKGFMFYLSTRLVKNLIQLPINIILVYIIITFVSKVKDRFLPNY